MRKRLIATIGLLSIASVSSVVAQIRATAPLPSAEERKERLEQIRAQHKERAQTRPAIVPPRPVGPVARPPRAPSVDWKLVLEDVTIARRQQLSQSLSTTRAPVAGTSADNTAGTTARPRGLRQANTANLPKDIQAEILRARIPVLVPASTRIGQTLKVFSHPNSYSATAEVDDGVLMRISGARKQLVLPQAPPRAARLSKLRDSKPSLPAIGAQYVITRSESATDLSFSRYACGYVISLMCDNPDTDARCTEDEYITQLASSMALLSQIPGDNQ